MNAEVLEKFLDYVYTGEVEVTIVILVIITNIILVVFSRWAAFTTFGAFWRCPGAI